MFGSNRSRRPKRDVSKSRSNRPRRDPQQETSNTLITSEKEGLSKPVVNIYLNRKANSTTILSRHLAENIDALNQFLLINFIYINQNNSNLVRQKGIRKTPTLIYGRRRFEGIQKIIQILTPPSRGKETYGYGVTSPEDMMHKWQSMIIDTKDAEDDEDEGDPDVRTQQIRSRMAAFQKRRPKMEGVGRKNKIRGGWGSTGMR